MACSREQDKSIKCPIPSRIDVTCSSLAYGDGALLRLNRELESHKLITRQRALMSLRDYLKDPEHITVAIKLGTLERLAKSLFDQDAMVRCTAAECLYVIAGHGVGRQGFIDHKVIGPLSCLFQDSVASVRLHAHAAFSRLALNPLAVEEMIDQHIIEMLVLKLTMELDDIIDVILKTLHECFKVDVQTALDCSCMTVLTDLLLHTRADIRAHAARAIMGLALTIPGKDKAVEAQCVKDLVTMLGEADGDDEGLIYSAGALMRIAVTTRGKYTELEAGALEPLMKLVKHPNHEVRLYALKALTCLSEAPEGRRELLPRADEIREAWSDPSTAVADAANICLKVILWKP